MCPGCDSQLPGEGWQGGRVQLPFRADKKLKFLFYRHSGYAALKGKFKKKYLGNTYDTGDDLIIYYLCNYLFMHHLAERNSSNVRVCVCVCSESTEGSEPRGASEEEDERAGVLAAAALPHHPLLHPQQARKGALPVPVSPACNA